MNSSFALEISCSELTIDFVLAHHIFLVFFCIIQQRMFSYELYWSCFYLLNLKGSRMNHFRMEPIAHPKTYLDINLVNF